MQFHLNGFQPGDPDVHPEGSLAAGLDELPEEVDVLIVGAGPAGLALAAQLSKFPTISTRVVERRSGPLNLGQADGIAVRTVEMFEAFGFGHRVLREAHWVNETTFWRPDPGQRANIVRTGRVQDTADGLSEFPHLIVNQARIHDYFVEVMKKSPSRLDVDYDYEFVGLWIGEGDRPVTVELRRSDGSTARVRAGYVVGTDGGSSRVRRGIGRELRGESADHAWGVMDILPITDFPDIRQKVAIQSGSGRNVLLIPREGGYLTRLYVDLGEVARDGDGEVRATPAAEVLAVANEVLHPYTLQAAETAWFSVYEVGQRLTDKFDDVPQDLTGLQQPRVFIAGDACHTHSAKAGQGMNVSMQDAFNLGWKLAAVIEGRATAALLDTYSEERQRVAQLLIDFDKEWSAMMAAGPRDPAHPERGGIDSDDLQAYFEKMQEYTAGIATHYPVGLLVDSGETQHLASGFAIGKRFHSAPVIRVCDARPLELGHVHEADGAWRLYAFADASEVEMAALMTFLAGATSPVVRFTPQGAAPDSVIDVRGIYQRRHQDVSLSDVPAALLPRKGRFELVDREKVFAPVYGSDRDIFDMRGIDREHGAIVLVRPDQHIAAVLPLSARSALTEFLGRTMVDQLTFA